MFKKIILEGFITIWWTSVETFKRILHLQTLFVPWIILTIRFGIALPLYLHKTFFKISKMYYKSILKHSNTFKYLHNICEQVTNEFIISKFFFYIRQRQN